MEVNFDSGSSISVNIPILLYETRACTSFDIKFIKPVLTTSINYAKMMIAEQIRLNIMMNYSQSLVKNAIKWNATNVWVIELSGHKMELYLLKDHITLINDLTGDWSSGPLVPAPQFIPYIYEFKFSITEFRIFFCINELNIIDAADDIAENSKEIAFYSLFRLLYSGKSAISIKIQTRFS
jgi:hypothetical protein